MLTRDVRSILLGLSGLLLAAPVAGQEPCTAGRIDDVAALGPEGADRVLEAFTPRQIV